MELTICGAWAKLGAGEISARELVQLRWRDERRESDVRALLTVTAKQALARRTGSMRGERAEKRCLRWRAFRSF